MITKEEWADIHNFKKICNGMYQVSNMGEVRFKESKQLIHKKIACKKRHPYYAVSLKTTDGQLSWVLVHQLVAIYFVPVSDKYKGLPDLVPDHLDNNGLNNHADNLEWKTRGDNVRSAFMHGFINYSCENSPSTSITNEQVHRICKLLQDGKTYDKIIDEMHFPHDKPHRQLLVRIKNRIAWTQISKDYNFNSKTIKYSEAQLEVVSRLKDIQRLIDEGYKNYDIVRMLWGNDINKRKLATRSQSITKIRNKEIFKELL